MCPPFDRDHRFNFLDVGHQGLQLVQIVDLDLHLDGSHQGFPVGVGRNLHNRGLALAGDRHNVCEQEAAVMSQDDQPGIVQPFTVFHIPLHIDQSGVIAFYIGTVTAVHLDAFTLGDEAFDIIPVDRQAALGQRHFHRFNARDNQAGLGLYMASGRFLAVEFGQFDLVDAAALVGQLFDQ